VLAALRTARWGRLRSVLSSAIAAVFNHPNRWKSRKIIQTAVPILYLSLAFATPGFSQASSLEEAAQVLARKVASTVHGGTASIERNNLSSLDEPRFSTLSEVFADELRRRGIRAVKGSADAKIVLTVSENATGYVGVAQVLRGEGSEITMASLGSKIPLDNDRSVSQLTLQKDILFSQERPILDVALNSGDPKRFEVLEFHQVVSYQLQGNRWVYDSALKLPVEGADSREQRGILRIGLDNMSVVLSAQICNFSLAEKESCHPNKNHLLPTEVPQEILESKKSPEWFASTRTESEGREVLLISGKDGLLRLYGEGTDPVSTFSGWGSEMTALRSKCDGGWQVLLTGKGDWAAEDSVQVAEVRGNSLNTIGPAIRFGGPIIALRAGQRNQELQPVSAVAVVHNLQTGHYEVYRLAITCAE
jgi:hypothetical protein